MNDAAYGGAAPAGADGLRARAAAALPAVLLDKYGPAEAQGWGPRMRAGFGHATPDDWYEASLDALVTPATRWLDVGCGRDLFPSNAATARRLAARCARLVGIDPDDNIDDNPWSLKGWNLTKQGAYVKEHGMAKAELAAKAANSRVGATRPTQPSK